MTTNNAAGQPRDHGRFAEIAGTHATHTDLNAAAVNDSYQLDEWVVLTGEDGKPVMRACFTNIGEGYNGEYDPGDEDDEPLLRLDFEVPSDSDFADEDSYTGDAGWSTVVGTTSTCTNTNADKVTPEQMRSMLGRVLADVNADIAVNGSPSSAIDRAEDLHEHFYAMQDVVLADARRARVKILKDRAEKFTGATPEEAVRILDKTMLTVEGVVDSVTVGMEWNYSHRDDMTSEVAVRDCYDSWASGAWEDENAAENLNELFIHIKRLSA